MPRTEKQKTHLLIRMETERSKKRSGVH